MTFTMRDWFWFCLLFASLFIQMGPAISTFAILLVAALTAGFIEKPLKEKQR